MLAGDQAEGGFGGDEKMYQFICISGFYCVPLNMGNLDKTKKVKFIKPRTEQEELLYNVIDYHVGYRVYKLRAVDYEDITVVVNAELLTNVDEYTIVNSAEDNVTINRFLSETEYKLFLSICNELDKVQEDYAPSLSISKR